MKVFKKICLFVLASFTLIGLTGCGNETQNVEGTLEDIMASLYAEIPEDERPMLGNIDVLNDMSDNIAYYTGTTDIEYEEVLASEPMMGSIAHSVVLIRMKDGADIEDAKTKIKEGIDPRKWICVEVPEEDVIVKNKGNLIVLIMVKDETTRNKIEKGFDNL